MVRGTPRKSLCVALCAGCLTFLTGCPAFAYTVGGGSTGGGPASAPGATPFTFSARFLDSNGNPIVGTMVTFSMSAGPAGAGCPPTLNPPPPGTHPTRPPPPPAALPPRCPRQVVLQAALAGGAARPPPRGRSPRPPPHPP